MPHLLISAGAGCGKSHTLSGLYTYIGARNRDHLIKQATPEQLAIYEWCDEHLPDSSKEKCGYAAFNAEIVDAMKPKVKNTCECKTFHGWGYKVVNTEFGFVKMNPARSNYLIAKITGKSQHQLEQKEKFKWLSVSRHVAKLKEELLPPTYESFQLIHSKYDDLAPFALFQDMEDYATRLLKEMKVVDPKIGIEYVDQVWLACFLAKKPIMPLGLIDECQDLSPARLLLARLLFENVIFCGDENQAINAYAGADVNSMQKIREIVSAELPLKQSFRCPGHVCNKVNAISPTAQLRPLPGRESEGTETRIAFQELPALLKKFCVELAPGEKADPNNELTVKYGIHQGLNNWEQTLILSRFNSSLIKTAILFHKHEIPCYVRGNTIIDNLCDIVENRKASCMEELDEKLSTWLSYCSRNAPDLVVAILQDKVECIRLVMEECQNPEDVPTALKKLLKPKNSKGMIKLSSIHGAKGLEAKHVFIFTPVVAPQAKKESEIKQEKNTHLVAVSRSALNIFWISQDE